MATLSVVDVNVVHLLMFVL